MLLSVEQQRAEAERLLLGCADRIGEREVGEILGADQSTQLGIDLQRARIAALKRNLLRSRDGELITLRDRLDCLVKRSVWVIGGDGWAYDIGFGGLDHALASGKNIKILVLDTEVYSNTGGQQSKSTPRGAIAKFAAAGKAASKKDLGRMAMSYGNVYVAQVAMGARDSQTLSSFLEAESYAGPALIIAYCPCIAHGYDMRQQLEHQKNAVHAGYWLLYRFDPRRAERGENPLQLDSKPPFGDFGAYLASENRFSHLRRSHPERAQRLEDEAKLLSGKKFQLYSELSGLGAK
jgi:pyruvate-ferredoxin/flavodoxin oxidoreductase